MMIALCSTHRRLRATAAISRVIARPTTTSPADMPTPRVKPSTYSADSWRTAAIMATTAAEASSRPQRLGSSSRMLTCRRAW